MPLVRVEASQDVHSPPAVVYGILADYREGHPAILPREYFEGFEVVEGGRGAGTRIRFVMRSFGSRRTYRSRVSEPEPGRVLVETDEHDGPVTRFVVEPLGDAGSRVTFQTDYPARGPLGWLEARIVPGYLARVYAAELELLRRRAEAAGPRAVSG